MSRNALDITEPIRLRPYDRHGVREALAFVQDLKAAGQFRHAKRLSVSLEELKLRAVLQGCFVPRPNVCSLPDDVVPSGIEALDRFLDLLVHSTTSCSTRRHPC